MKTQDTNTLINQVIDFYRQYLSCSPEQLDLLALWTFHTHSFLAAPFSPSLYIHSRHQQCGKTLCLQLLRLLCDDAWMHTAASPSLLLRQLTNDEPNSFIGTLLLDDCHATFGSSRMNIKLQGLLTARFQQDARFTVPFKDGDGELDFVEEPAYFAAAFAGNGRLHPCLAERSIQIALESKAPGSPQKPFRFFAARNQTRSLWETLRQWGADHDKHFSAIAPYKEDQFPSELSWRQRDCAEPLLHIADFIGGEWPQRARKALVNAFALAAFEDFYSSKQILFDLRDAFSAQGNPEWVSSAGLLKFLHTIDDRNWHEWNKGKPMVPKQLAGLLEPFGVRPRSQRTGPDKDTVIRGYKFQDLEPIWKCHLQPANPVAAKVPSSVVAANLQNQQAVSNGNIRLAARPCPEVSAEGSQQLETPVAAKLQNPSTHIAGSQLEANGKKPTVAVVAANLEKPGSLSNEHVRLATRPCPKVPAEESQQLVASRSYWPAAINGSQKPKVPVLSGGIVKKEGIGYRILTNK